MLTLPAAEIVRDDRPAYRPFAMRVTSLARLSPSFVRVAFTGDDVHVFGTDRCDQRVKIVFPRPGAMQVEEGDADWYGAWRDAPADQRPAFRTYTVRSIDPDRRELVIDFVDHAEHGVPQGPASRWLATASLGDEVMIVGPDARSLTSHIGIDWHPGDATDVLLVGDETAVPAISAIVEALPATMRAHVLVEVPCDADRVAIPTDASLSATWICRDRHDESLDDVLRAWVRSHRDILTPALAAQEQSLEEIDVDRDMLWDSPLTPSGGFYAWIAGESALVKGLRRQLVREHGVDRAHVAFMGYWRRGKAEAQE